MRPTETLKSEHRVIERVLRCLLAAVEHAEDGGEFDARSFSEAIEFLRKFADGCHHRKEEDELFPALEELGVPREDGPIGVMLDEHGLGRSHIRGMAEALPRATQGDAAARRAFFRHAREYAELLFGHIEKEDRILFHMADQVLGPDGDARLNAGFDRICREIGDCEHERLVRIADDLCDRWGVSHHARVSPGCGCSFHEHP